MFRIAITTFGFSTGTAFAHTGHKAAIVHGDAHWLMQADHLAVVIAALLVGGILLRRLVGKGNVGEREPSRRPS